MPPAVSGCPSWVASARRVVPISKGSVCRNLVQPACAEAATALLPPPVLSEPTVQPPPTVSPVTRHDKPQMVRSDRPSLCDLGMVSDKHAAYGETELATCHR